MRLIGRNYRSNYFGNVKRAGNTRLFYLILDSFKSPDKMNPQQQFFEKYAAQAQSVCKGTGLLTSVCLAQAALESGYGKSLLTTKGNNFFGHKASKEWTAKKLPVLNLKTWEQKPTGEMYQILAPFKVYPTAKAAFEDRLALFQRLPRYKSLFKIDSVESEAALLLKCGYCTDLKYPGKIVAIIKTYGLTKYDV